MIYNNNVLTIKMSEKNPYCFLVENNTPQLLSIGNCEAYYLSKGNSLPRVRHHAILNFPEQLQPFGKFIVITDSKKILSSIISTNNDVIAFYITDNTNQRRYCTRFKFDGWNWYFISQDSERIAPENVRYPLWSYEEELKTRLLYEITMIVSGRLDLYSTVFLLNILKKANATINIKKKINEKTGINELDLSVRTYNRLKRNGINNLGDIKARGDDVEEIVKEKGMLEISEGIKKAPTFDGFEFICGGIKATYSFTRFNVDKISSVILEALMKNKTKGATIFDKHDILDSNALYWLFLRGYLYISDMRRDKEILAKELDQMRLRYIMRMVEELLDEDVLPEEEEGEFEFGDFLGGEDIPF